MSVAAELPRFSGFADPVFDSQTSFRAIMNAMANPGRIVTLPVSLDAPARLAPAMAAAALTLIDHDTPVFLDRALAVDREISACLSFHTGCRFVDEPSRAGFALIGDPEQAPDLARFAQGTLEYPDRSSTLLIEVSRFDDENGMRLAGPGIKGFRRFDAWPLPPKFRDQLGANRERFPQGVDLLFCCGDRLAGLPRSTRIEG